MIHPKNNEEYEYDKSFGLVIVKYSAQWCGPCKRIEPVVEKYAEEYPNITFMSVDIDEIENEDTESIKLLPTFRFFIDGREKFSLEGADKHKLKEHIEMLEEENRPSYC